MITTFFTARQLITLDALPKGQKDNQECFIENILPSLLNEKNRFSRQKIAIIFLCPWTTRCVTIGIKLSMNYVA
jgi:hypothetical protein